ncbi:hypothetical protein K1719_002633 [Acacia pycnantha]|nr:hypothetical protein K1719_002633 [Acacia pycnantha]
MMPPRDQEMDEEMKANNKKRKREILEENKDNEITRYDHQDSNKLFFYRPPHLVNLVQQVMQKIEEDLGGSEIKMLIQKKICRCDLSFHAFSIPENEILEDARDFLKPHEVEILKMTSCQSISVSLFDHNLQQFQMFLSWWQMNNLSFYNLSHCWKEVVQRNNLKLDDMVQLWSFRRDHLGFALVKLTQ